MLDPQAITSYLHPFRRCLEKGDVIEGYIVQWVTFQGDSFGIKQTNENIFTSLTECKHHSSYTTIAVLTLLSMLVESCPHCTLNV